MNKFSAVSTEDLVRVEGGVIVLIAIAAGLALSGCVDDFEEPGEPLPGFDDFLANTRRIARGG